MLEITRFYMHLLICYHRGFKTFLSDKPVLSQSFIWSTLLEDVNISIIKCHICLFNFKNTLFGVLISSISVVYSRYLFAIYIFFSLETTCLCTGRDVHYTSQTPCNYFVNHLLFANPSLGNLGLLEQSLEVIPYNALLQRFVLHV